MASTLYEYFTTPISVYHDTYTLETAKTVLSQTFTMGTVSPDISITLESIKILLTKVGTPSGNLTVEIRSTDSNVPDEVLASGTIALSTISTAGWYECNNFVGNTTLSPTTKYAIVIHHLESTDSANEIQWHADDGSGAYAGGSAYKSTDNGANWALCSAAADATDFGFQIFGDTYNGTMCSYSDVINKVGSGANSAARSVFNVSNYVQQAESLVNARTRKNWTDIYSTINTDVRYILNEVVSCIAALRVINYDITGYASRLEAEDMKNLLKSQSEQLIAVLNDRKTQSFIENE